MYRNDRQGGNQVQTTAPWALVPRNVFMLPPAPIPGKTGLGCAGVANCPCKSLGMGAIDMSSVGLAGYAALGVGVWLVAKVLFTGDRAKERREALKSVEADYRARRDEVKARYPRL